MLVPGNSTLSSVQSYEKIERFTYACAGRKPSNKYLILSKNILLKKISLGHNPRMEKASKTVGRIETKESFRNDIAFRANGILALEVEHPLLRRLQVHPNRHREQPRRLQINS